MYAIGRGFRRRRHIFFLFCCFNRRRRILRAYLKVKSLWDGILKIYLKLEGRGCVGCFGDNAKTEKRHRKAQRHEVAGIRVFGTQTLHNYIVGAVLGPPLVVFITSVQQALSEWLGLLPVPLLTAAWDPQYKVAVCRCSR